MGKFEKNSSGIAVNMLFNSKIDIYTASRSGFNRKYSNKDNLIMILDREKRHYTADKNIPRLIKAEWEKQPHISLLHKLLE